MKTLFKNCDIVTTTDSSFEVIRNGFCGVDGSYICYLGTDKPAEKYDIIKDMTGRVLYPGLINAHNHAAMTLLRGRGRKGRHRAGHIGNAIHGYRKFF